MFRKISRTMYVGSMLTLLLAQGCSSNEPQYPKCSNDGECHAGEFCINGQCQQCRTNADCPADRACQSGRCEQKQFAQRACQTNKDCPGSAECQNGQCVAPPSDDSAAGEMNKSCALDPIYFGYNDYLLNNDAAEVLRTKVYSCLKQSSANKIVIEGHCDSRGTSAYNLSLGERRAHSVQKYLSRLGISTKQMSTLSKGELDSTGTEESGWARDRRAQFSWK